MFVYSIMCNCLKLFYLKIIDNKGPYAENNKYITLSVLA